jgi:hypothetical protein
MPIKLLSTTLSQHFHMALRPSLASTRMAVSPFHYMQNLSRPRAHPYSTRTSKSPSPTPSPPKPNPLPENPSLPSFNLFQQVRDSRPAVRYTVYAGLGLMITVESTFWFNVIKAKFFPSQSVEEQAEAEAFMSNVQEAVTNSRAAWMGNYGRYYGGYMWGVGER